MAEPRGGEAVDSQSDSPQPNKACEAGLRRPELPSTPVPLFSSALFKFAFSIGYGGWGWVTLVGGPRRQIQTGSLFQHEPGHREGRVQIRK